MASNEARAADRIETGPRFTESDAIRLNNLFRGTDTPEMLRSVLKDKLIGDVAVVSSFGAESAVLLHLIAEVDKAIPVIFLETHKHFPETIAYRDALVAHLGLTNLLIVEPDASLLEAKDGNGLRWSWDPDGCCEIRKVQPLARALSAFDASVSGRKGFQSSTRAGLPRFEIDRTDAEGRLKFNPLASWSPEDIEAHMVQHALPRHPLVELGYPSIGCAPCTSKVAPGEDPRSGRWKGWDKVECGIHVPGSPDSNTTDGELPPGYDPAF
ncbi:MAG: phosphoadenylyl-sulfate reductase [Novosphingobium sp.]|uniref:phosphoadenylyl-sulfate reductase n=1 Tax=Novosphingobium sp. TaxID=1874826 RepID=UPI00301B5E6D